MFLEMNNKLKGYLLGIIGGAAYGTNPLFAIPLYSSGLDASSVIFYRYLTATVLVALVAKAKGCSLRIERKALLVALGLGLMVVGSSLTLFHSYNYMGSGVASTILFVYPIMVAIMLAAIFGEKVDFKTGASIILALVGVALLYFNGEGLQLNTVGTVLALLSAFTYAVYMVFLNKSRLRRIPTIVVTFYILLCGLTIYLPMFIMGFRPVALASGSQFALVFCSALLPTVISFLCTASAVVKIGSTPASILGALEPGTAVIIGVLVFDESMTVRTFVGMMLILVAVTTVVLSKNGSK